ncbi:MAG: PE-PPE domain-containing protein, partial [Mycobacterium sp.]
PDSLRFLALGPPNMPEYGLFGAFLPGLMTALFTPAATEPFPADSPYPVDVYCGEYDPICDSPDTWNNLLVDWNAAAALSVVHGGYLHLTTDQVESAVPIPMADTGNVSFYMMQDDNSNVLPMFAHMDNTQLAEELSEQLRPYIDAAYTTPLHLDAGVSLADMPNLFTLLVSDLLSRWT